MFKVRFIITLKNGSRVSLYGEDYFGDKKVFWETHQPQLYLLCKRVCEQGFPIEIEDCHSGLITTLTVKEDFDAWLKANQPFTCTCH